jgi:hypothetical protein
MQANIKEGSTLLIVFYNINVTVTITTPYGKMIVVTVDIMDTLGTVKDRIKEKENLDKEKYVLKSGEEELDDGKTMDSIIKERKTIEIVFKTIKITVKGQRKTFTMTVYYGDSIKMLKERIHKIDGTPLDRTEIRFNNRILTGTKTISQLGIKEGAILKLIYTSIKIQVQIPATGTTLTL